MYATDVDPEESAKTRKRLAEQGFGEDILTVKLQNFCTIDEIAKEAGGFDFILADLGVSSMQIDNPKRGFSFRADAPLDLRLREHSLDGIPEARQAVHTEKQDILYAPVLQVIQHSQPELGGFGCTYCDA